MSMNLKEFFLKYYIPLRLNGRSKRTHELYGYSIKLFGESLGHEATIKDLTDLKISDHLEKLRTRERPLSPYSIEKERSQLLALSSLAFRRGLLKVRPEVQRGILPERTPKAWTMDELERLLKSCREEEGFIAEIPAADWWVAIHMVLWDCAERITAVLSLRWEWLKDGWIHIPAEVRKEKTKDKTFPLRPETLEALGKIREPERDIIFATFRGARWTNVYYHYGKILKRAGLEAYEGKFHRMRKSVASHYRKAGHDAQDLLGHKDARTTAKYMDPRILDLPAPSKVLPSIGGKGRRNSSTDEGGQAS